MFEFPCFGHPSNQKPRLPVHRQSGLFVRSVVAEVQHTLALTVET
jgi:hypothetical protein